jgi:hypothetical protein
MKTGIRCAIFALMCVDAHAQCCKGHSTVYPKDGPTAAPPVPQSEMECIDEKKEKYTYFSDFLNVHNSWMKTCDQSEYDRNG